MSSGFPSWQNEDPELQRLLESMPEVKPPLPYPFWNYADLFLLAAAAFLATQFSLLAAVGVSQMMFGKTAGMANKVLPAQFGAYALWLLAGTVLLRIRYQEPFWRSMGWVAPKRAVWMSFFSGPVLAVWVGIASYFLRTPRIHDPFQQFTSDRFTLWLLGFFIVILGPVCEELAFRGLLQPLLVRDLGPFFGIFATAVPFALLHGAQYQWQWQQLVLICLVGMAFGLARHYTGSTASSTVMHSTYNLTLFSSYLSQLLRNT